MKWLTEQNPPDTRQTGGQSMELRDSQNGIHAMGAEMGTTGSRAATDEALATRRYLLVMAVCGPVPGLAWPIDKPKRIGLLAFGARRPRSLETFATRMAELGWKEGRDYVVEWRVTAHKAERLADAAAELVTSRVDVFLCSSTAEVLAVRKATTTIPIVITGVSDPVASGLVRSLGRPEGNITGFSSIGEQLSGQRLSLLRELLPAIRTLAVVWSAEDATHAREMLQIEELAPKLALEVRRVELSRIEDIAMVFEQLQRNPPGAVLLLGNVWHGRANGAVERAALSAGLPTLAYDRSNATNGALLSYGPDYEALDRDAAGYIDKIFKGAKVADLPIQQPTKFDLFINLKTARALGLSVPRTVLLRADAVIE
jgi:putative ABC transport system substrate-binding protein